MKDKVFRLGVAEGEIEVTVDAPVGPQVGRVVFLPPFGMSAERMFPAAYLLTINGFEVFRVDAREHSGEGSGTIETFKLSGLTDDLSAVLGVAADSIVVAVSLSARSVMRALRGRRDVRAGVLLTPVVNVRSTLNEVFGYDLFRMFYDGKDVPRLVRVLGHDVETNFVLDCIKSGMVGVDDAVTDLADWSARLTFVAGDADPWVQIGEVREAAARSAARGLEVEVVSVEAASHQLYRNPVLAMMYLQTATRECLRIMGHDPNRAVCPPFSEIVAAVEGATKRERKPREQRRPVA
jgi:pimeloyl-ACP methyl ester carboxylesterase